jgi:hypothetical protein
MAILGGVSPNLAYGLTGRLEVDWTELSPACERADRPMRDSTHRAPHSNSASSGALGAPATQGACLRVAVDRSQADPLVWPWCCGRARAGCDGGHHGQPGFPCPTGPRASLWPTRGLECGSGNIETTATHQLGNHRLPIGELACLVSEIVDIETARRQREMQ